MNTEQDRRKKEIIFLALSPLILGSGTFLLWLITNSIISALLGAIVIFYGVINVSSGHKKLNSYQTDFPEQAQKSSQLRLLLHSNYAICAVYIFAFFSLGNFHPVYVRNDCDKALTFKSLSGVASPPFDEKLIPPYKKTFFITRQRSEIFWPEFSLPDGTTLKKSTYPFEERYVIIGTADKACQLSLTGWGGKRLLSEDNER